MRPVTLDEEMFARLTGEAGEALVSVLFPTHLKGPDIAQDRIRLKNALTEVDDLLEQDGRRRRWREALLRRAHKLLTNDEFWAHQGQGLALYIGEDGELAPVALSDHPEPLVSVADAYHVRHLFSELLRTPLDALVLTKGHVGLYLVDPRSASRVEADLPASMEDANWFMDRESQLQQRAERAGPSTYFHGHDPSDRMDEDVSRFLRGVAHALPETGREDPLVVMGDEPLIDQFRRICRRNIVGVSLDGTSDESEALVHRRVRKVIDDRFSVLLDDHRRHASEAIGSAETVTLFPEALQAAVTGRIAKLYLHRAASPIWGHFDPTTLESAAGLERSVGTVDLLDRLAVAARGTGAAVHPMSDAVEGHDFVGVLRF
jgi:hypothetical protein